MNRTALFILGMAAAIPAAHAAEPSIYSPQFSWAGVYAGFQGGYGFFELANTDTSTPPVTVGVSPGGLYGGVYAGYNAVTKGNLVLGVEAEIGAASISATSTPGLTYEGKVNWLGSARGRFGAAFDRTLVFVTGGAAFAGVSESFDNLPADGSVGTYSDVRAGWTVGAGIEHALTDTITARVDYRYYDFGSIRHPYAAIAPLSGWLPSSTDIKAQTVSAGIGLKF